MIKFVLRNGIRALVKQLPYSFINILGLTIGIGSVLMLIVWISVETSFENFHKDKDRLYRVNLLMKTPNRIINSGSINAPAGPEFKKAFPVVENMVRLSDRTESVTYRDKTSQMVILYTDSTFFGMFTFDLVTGNKTSCLEDPGGIVLTQKGVLKIFGQDDPMGRELLIAGKPFRVVAVAKDPPVNTNLQFDCLAPLSVITKQAYIGWDGGMDCYSYLKLVEGADPSVLQNQITEYMKGAINNKYANTGYALNPYLQKITDIHLDPETEYDLGEKGSKTQLLMFSAIGLLILLIACFNFVNISTALSLKRAKEVSVRKIFGAGRIQIIGGFVIESAIAILISVALGFFLVKILLPYTSDMIGKGLTLHVISPLALAIIFILLFIFCTVFASFYSSFYLSSMNPLILLTTINSGKKRQVSRNILVTFQYTISIALIISCIVIYSQMIFAKNSDKGFDQHNILMINLNSKTSPSFELVINKFSSIPGISSVSVSAGGAPGLGFTSNGYKCEGVEKNILSNAVYVNETYLRTMGISLADGRDFRNLRGDSNKVIINQTFAKTAGWTNPIGKTISRNRITYEVIGEVKDFNTGSIHSKTEPVLITTVNEWGRFNNIIIKYLPSNLPEVLKSSEKILKEIDPQGPFEYEFLEDSLMSSYSGERKLNILFLVLAVIAIFISSLGLFGMATFATQSRMREIGIRKINGAMVSDIFRAFSFDLLKWIIIAFVIAIPIGYSGMARWLDNFAFKTRIGIWIFLVAGLFTLILGFLTVIRAATKAARTNPAETLRKD